MGGGGLRILGHKKWHVWRRDNIERVERDEREHREQQRKLREEQWRTDQEKRIETLLATKVNGSSRVEDVPQHINFFQKEEESHTMALLKGGSNERSRPGASDTLGKQGHLPWYATKADDKEDKTTCLSSNRELKRKRWMEIEDPLRKMRVRQADDEKEELEDERARTRVEKRRRRSRDETRDDENSHIKKSKKTERRKKNRKVESRDDLIAKLRQDRLDREAIERERARRLVHG